MKKRYFIVFYVANSNAGFVHGQIDITLEGNVGLFLNRKKTFETILSDIKNVSIGLKEICITNFIEISQDEFEIWIEK